MIDDNTGSLIRALLDVLANLALACALFGVLALLLERLAQYTTHTLLGAWTVGKGGLLWLGFLVYKAGKARSPEALALVAVDEQLRWLDASLDSDDTGAGVKALRAARKAVAEGLGEVH